MLSSSQIHPLPSLNVALEIDRSGRVAIRSPNNRVASPRFTTSGAGNGHH